MKHATRNALEAAGWRAASDAAWERLGELRNGVAFLAPPLDTIPSPLGNAIYCLVEALAERLSPPPLVLARWPANGAPGRCAVADRILYDCGALVPGPFEAALPYRVKKAVWGSGAPYLRGYAKRAAEACAEIGIGTIVIEDVPAFAPVVRQKLGPAVRVLLHQHIDAAKSSTRPRWRSITKGVDGVIFVAEQTRRFTEILHGRLAVPSWVIYNGVDERRFDKDRFREDGEGIRKALGIPVGATVLLFVGRIIPGKGIAEAAQAFNALRRDDCWLVVVGDLQRSLYATPAYTERLKSAASESGGRTILAGQVPQAELPAWYAAADAVVVPSTASEGLPKTITEALAMGKPCLVTDRGGARELVQDGVNGWIIPDPVTPVSIRDGMMRAIAEFRRLSPAASPVDISLEGMVRGFERILAGDAEERASS